jgi:2-amino-4-hydroxy-6-hydroxymethyldihydropteridine diphosphokinase
MRHIAYISIGSNVGDRAGNCSGAMTAIGAVDGIEVISRSKLFWTEPVDYRDQPWFVNAMVKISTTLEPLELLNVLKKIERESGRAEQKIRFGPRVLDLDILFYEDRVINSDRLVVPHPRMHQRGFVLRPFCDIDPTVEHPVYKKNVQQLFDMLNEQGQEVRVYE